MSFFKGNGNGGTQQRPPMLSMSMSSFFTTDSSPNGEYSAVAVGVYGQNVTLNFMKGIKGNPPTTAYLSMNYEAATIVARTLWFIKQTRKKCFAAGEEYPIWEFKNTIQFTDKETKGLRTLGVFEIRTEISPVTNRNTVYICYTQGADSFKVALGSGQYTANQHEFSIAPDFDIGDSRFSAFCDQFITTVFQYPVLMMNAKINAISVGKFKQLGGGSNGNSRYTDTNYRSPGSSSDGGMSGGGSTAFPDDDAPF